MNGVKYYRIKRGLRQKELCRMAGISLFTLVRMEHADRDSVGKLLAEHYRRVRIVLDAPVDELLREDLPEVEEGTHVRNMRPSGSECADNCLAVYRQAHHLPLHGPHRWRGPGVPLSPRLFAVRGENPVVFVEGVPLPSAPGGGV